ncbi:MAG: AAA domain-containing protein [Spirosomaceae bacterium]|nr:AAA domain-containing protein [Spirosomataceae bacterium]
MNQYQQIFQFLLEFSKLRNRIICDVENYESVFWLSELPHSVITILNKPDTAYWLKAERPNRVEKPMDLPTIATDEAKEEYNQHLESYNQYKESSSIYRQLFDAYKKIQNFGDEYELLMGVGLLYHTPNQGTKLRRHIVTTRATIEFNNRNATIEVKPDPTVGFAIELDMCSGLPAFQSDDARQFLNEPLNNFEGTFFSENIIGENGILQQATKVLHAEAEYITDIVCPNSYQPLPTVYYAPALILRKRNARSLTTVYERILQQFEENINFDASCLRTVLEVNAPLTPDDQRTITFQDDTVYFPKPYNAEQRDIINRLKNRNAVVVQGPPGTGKSHTIANLLCHLLAHGNRVLVTAQTKRALESLKSKIPDEVKPLIVTMLGDDTQANNNLEASVNGITTKLDNADIGVLNNQITRNVETLQQLIDSKKKYEEELEVRRSLDLELNNFNPQYNGNLEELSKKITERQSLFDWFTDEVGEVRVGLLAQPNRQPNKDIQWHKIDGIQTDFQNLHDLVSTCKDFVPEDFQGDLPNLTNLPDLEALKTYFTTISEFEAEYQHQSIEPLPSNNVMLLRLLEDWTTITYQRATLPQPQTGLSKRELQRDAQKIRTFLAQFENRPFNKLWQEFEVTNRIELEEKPFQNIRADCQILLQHLQTKRATKLDFGLLSKLTLPANIKNLQPFTQQNTVNGQYCDSVTNLELLVRYCDFRIRCSTIVQGDFQYNQNLELDLRDRLEYLEVTVQQLEAIENANHEITQLENQIGRMVQIQQPIDKEQIEQLRRRVIYTQVRHKYDDAKNNIFNIVGTLQNPGYHLVVTTLAENIQNQNWKACNDNIEEVKTLYRNRKTKDDCNLLLQRCRAIFPHLSNAIEDGIITTRQVQSLADAIYWKNAHWQLQNALNQTEEALTNAIRQQEKTIGELTAQLAADKAWVEVLGRVTPELAQNLTRWSQAMRRARGNGVRAMQNRKEAQSLMAECQQIVPCWIMPLPKLVETLHPDVAIYDYVIVDEASQLGPDAMFLMYLAKNIIVVGDDKQTAPQYIGITIEQVTDLINRFLNNVPFKNFFNTDYSFFDHATAFCAGTTVTLREHFRCMPEIIEFSNRNFYQLSGIELYPLKQYNQNRLEPLKSTFVQGGMVESTGPTIHNAVEANKIVATIQAMLKDERYAGKTLGVIALQGQKQAQIINQKLLELIEPSEYEARKIICGDAKNFQGDERDIILLSLVTAPNHPRNALTTPEYQRTFNVASSRAKEQMWLFHSVKLDELQNDDDLRYKLLYYFTNPNQPIIPRNDRIGSFNPQQLPPPFQSVFEIDVYNIIVERGYGVIPQYKVSRYSIDLVVVLHNGIKIAVECDGDRHHSTPDQIQRDIIREGVLKRVGWQFFRVRSGKFYHNRIKAMEKLWPLLEREATVQMPPKQSDEPPKPNNTPAPSPQNGRQMPLFQEQKTQQLGIFEANEETIAQQVPQKNMSNNLTKSTNQGVSLIFTNQQRVYVVKTMGLNNEQLRHQIKFEPQEKSKLIVKTSDFEGYMLFGFENGKVAKVHLKSFLQTHKKIEKAYNNESKLCFIKHIEQDIDLVAYSKKDDGRTKVFVFNTSLITHVDSKTSKGVNVMKLEERGGKLDALKELRQVNLGDVSYYARQNIPNTGVFLKDNDSI